MPKFYMTMTIPQTELDTVLTSTGPGAAVTTMTRAEAFKAYQAGDLQGPVSFIADVWSNGKNKNHTRLNEDELPGFAASFVGKPFLKDHKPEQDSRGGTIRGSELMQEGDRKFIRQRIELVKDWAKEGYFDGTIDKFSIGWDAEQYLCTVCGKDFMDDEVKHSPWDLGKKDKPTGKTVEMLMKGLEGDETSAVTHPAIGDTGIREQVAQLCAAKKRIEGRDGIVVASLETARIDVGNSSGATPEQKGDGMLQKIVSLLSLSSDATEDEAMAELDKRLKSPPMVPEAVLNALGLTPRATENEAVLAIVKKTAPGTVVAKADFDALLVRVNRAEAGELIRKGEDEGKITPANRSWFEKLAGENPDLFRQYIAEAPTQIPPGQKAYNSAEIAEQKTGDNEYALTEDDRIVLRNSNFTEAEFIQAKKLERGGEFGMAARLRTARREVN